MNAVFLLPLLLAGVLAQNQVHGPDYIAKSAAEKMDLIWENINMDTSSGPWPGIHLGEIFFEDMCITLYQDGDEMPIAWTGNPRKKYIHSVGSHGKVEFVSSGDHSYTGIFEGASQGIIRISLAQEPDTNKLATAPGMGLKFLRDGIESGSMVAMYSVEGQESWNLLKNDWTNHVGAGGGVLFVLGEKFGTATPYIQYVSLSDMARYREDGSDVGTPVFPFMLKFKPNPELQNFPDEYHGPFTDDLAGIPVDTMLFSVYALDAPEGTETMIGELVLRSEMTTSNWGDTRLFFRHQNMIEDLAIHPEWEPYLETVYVPGSSQSCPFHRK